MRAFLDTPPPQVFFFFFLQVLSSFFFLRLAGSVLLVGQTFPLLFFTGASSPLVFLFLCVANQLLSWLLRGRPSGFFLFIAFRVLAD